MKKLKIWTFAAMLLMSSCYDDLGNYDYTVPEEISISGIEENYLALVGTDSISIIPEIKSTDPNARFECCWMVYRVEAGQIINTYDTIGVNKNLNLLVNLEAMNWHLVFSVKNLNTGYTAYASSNLLVSTEFKRGWYISTHDGTNSNIDLHYTSEEEPLIPDGRVAHHVLSNINGHATPGAGGVFAFFHDYKTWNSKYNRFLNTRSLMHQTDQEIHVIDINTFKIIRTFKDLFFQTPNQKAPLAIFFSNTGIFLNNGQAGIHNLYTRGVNSGQFASALTKDNQFSPYSLSKFYIASKTRDNPVFFDELSTSFVSASATGISLISIKDDEHTEMSATNTNKKLLYMQIRYDGGTSSREGVAVMQDISDPDLKMIAKIKNINTNNFKIDNDTLTRSDKMYQAKVFGQNFMDENLLYFGLGNELWSRSLQNAYERLQYALPEDEKITYISHKRNTRAEINFIAIASQKGNEFIVRMFEKQAGNLLSEPKIVIHGEGQFSDIIYMYPKLYTTSCSYRCPWSR